MDVDGPSLSSELSTFDLATPARLLHTIWLLSYTPLSLFLPSLLLLLNAEMNDCQMSPHNEQCHITFWGASVPLLPSLPLISGSTHQLLYLTIIESSSKQCVESICLFPHCLFGCPLPQSIPSCVPEPFGNDDTPTPSRVLGSSKRNCWFYPLSFSLNSQMD